MALMSRLCRPDRHCVRGELTRTLAYATVRMTRRNRGVLHKARSLRAIAYHPLALHGIRF